MLFSGEIVTAFPIISTRQLFYFKNSIKMGECRVTSRVNATIKIKSLTSIRDSLPDSEPNAGSNI